ncbi:MAG: hypothetical protein WA581_12970 [Candidatus Acidiferrales bacterium]
MTIFAGSHEELETRRERMRRGFVECKCGLGRKWSYPCPVCHAFVGTIEELGEVLVRSIGRYTEEEKKQIREGMNRRGAKTEWERMHPDRLYEKEWKN